MIITELNKHDTIDCLTIENEIGRGKGNFGIVYHAVATCPVNKKPEKYELAFKLFSVNEHDSEHSFRYEKFCDEVKALNILKKHPHIVEIYDPEPKEDARHNGSIKKINYYRMELLGNNLSYFINANSSKWSVASKLNILLQIASALKYAHSKNVFHRDLYSDNIIFSKNDPEIAKITDFGSTKLLNKKQTNPYYWIVGAMDCSSPESCVGLLGSNVTEAALFKKADVFSLSLLLYHIMTAEKLIPVAMVLRGTFAEACNRGLLIKGALRSKKEELLNNYCIPTLDGLMIKDIIITEKIKNREKVQKLLNEAFTDSYNPNYLKRLKDVESFESRIKECQDLIK